LNADDTPIKVLAPGSGKTKRGHLWTYVRDGTAWGSKDPPAVWYQYSPSWHGKYPQKHLASFQGKLQVDGYAGFEPLFLPTKPGVAAPVEEISCMAHARRYFYEVHIAQASPLAKEALERIGGLYQIEDYIRGSSSDKRLAARQRYAVPLLKALQTWMTENLSQIDKKSALAEAFRYSLNRWDALCRYAHDGRVEIGRVSDWRGNHTLRGVAVVRQSRCLNPRRGSRFQSLLVEPDMQSYRIRLSRKRLRPSLSSRLHGSWVVGRGRASHKGTRSDIGGTRCLASLAAVSTIAADANQCNAG
jgi:hypothetical protein